MTKLLVTFIYIVVVSALTQSPSVARGAASTASDRRDQAVATVTHIQTDIGGWNAVVGEAQKTIAAASPTPALAASLQALADAAKNLDAAAAAAKDALETQDNAAALQYKMTLFKLKLAMARSAITRAHSTLANAGDADLDVARNLLQLGQSLDAALARLDAVLSSGGDDL